MSTEIVMPRLGEGVIEGTIARWLKQEGDQVEQYEPLLEIETDKVTTEATAEVAGTLLKIVVPEGETVEVGTVLGVLGEAGEAVKDAAPAEETPATQERTNGSPQAPAGAVQPVVAAVRQQRERSGLGRISPVVARIADEHDVDLTRVPGTGRNGRITKKDILAYVERQDEEPAGSPPPTPAPTPAPTARPTPVAPAPAPGVPGEIVALTNMRRSIAEHMVHSKKTSPHVTTVFEVDLTAVAAHRAANKEAFARDGARLTYTAYLVSAITQALKQHPMVNSQWTDEGILLQREINVGMAAAVERGLIVPVIRQADSYSLLGLARVINDLTEKARANQLSADDIQGGTFTLTNHGVSGSLFATPIINQPQCGILGAGKIEKRVRVVNDAIAIRTMAYLSFTFDHRILDGATADNFVATVVEVLESWS